MKLEIASDVVCPWCYIGKRRLEKALGLNARVIAEGRSEGIEFAFDRIERTPNTVAAHKLIQAAQQTGLGDLVKDALFRAYFEEARDIGDPAVLAAIAARCGVKGWPENAPDLTALEDEVRAMGITAVPTFIFDRKSGISGAYPAETLAAAIRQASK